MKQGYGRVYWFKGGISAWRSFNYPLQVNNKFQGIRVKKLRPAAVADLLGQDNNYYVLDVRPQNYTKGPHFIKGSHHCPLLNIMDRVGTIPRDQPIIVVDWKMMQSPLAAKYLLSEGFQVKGVVRGGIERWAADGLPTEVRTVAK